MNENSMKNLISSWDLNPGLLNSSYIVEPPNKGHIRDNINLTGLSSFVERLSSLEVSI